ncbi:MAG: YfcE family phosphodiesterase [Patescibacteria group bacterium]
MKILIISDIHDNMENLKKCLQWGKNQSIENVICCGDITNSETLKYLSENFFGKINLVKGNMEIYEETEIKLYKNINYLGLFGVAEFTDKKIGICHKPELIAKIKKLDYCDFIFYGHTHQPDIKECGKTTIVNPGTLGGVFFKASFGVLDTAINKLELKILELI